MENIKFTSDLSYPDCDVLENIADAKLIMPNYGGQASELTAILTYCYQSYVSNKDADLKYILLGIAQVEMHHHEMLGLLIYNLGMKPIMGAKTYWNGGYINYNHDPKMLIQQNILGEENAILNYKRTIANLKTENAKLVLARIILDEEIHLDLFKNLLKLY